MLNSFQRLGRISLKQSTLKIGHLAESWKPPWAQGVGRSNRPAPTNRIKYIHLFQVNHLSKRQVVKSEFLRNLAQPVEELQRSLARGRIRTLRCFSQKLQRGCNFA